MPAVPRDIDAAPVAWREAGEGPVVLLLHGMGGSRIAWEPQLAALSVGWRCVAWDMPGYGASEPLVPPGASPSPLAPPPVPTFPELAAAAAGLLDTLGAPRAHLVGLSMGGMIALHTAALFPHRVRSLALLDTSPAFGLDGTDPGAWIAARLAPLDAGREPAEFAEEVLRSVMAPDPPVEAVRQAVAAMARVPAEGLRAAVWCLPTHDVRPLLPTIAAPALVLVGEHDEETPPSYAATLAANLPDARLSIVPGAGHLTNLERPDAVNHLLAAFLAEVEAEEAASAPGGPAAPD